MRTCETMAHRPISLASHGSFEMFKISSSEAQTVSHYQSPFLVCPTTVPVSVYVHPCRSISVTFHRHIFHTLIEDEIRNDSPCLTASDNGIRVVQTCIIEI